MSTTQADYLPSFVVPSGEVEEIKLMHGSCRKAHGEGYDSMVAVDKALENGYLNEDRERPQLLCLTGDQIYADDVADSLLQMIIDQSAILFDSSSTDKYKEPFPITYVSNEFGYPYYPPPVTVELPSGPGFDLETDTELIDYTEGLEKFGMARCKDINVYSSFEFIDSLTFEDESAALRPLDLRPGQRHDFIRNSCGFSSEAETSKSHLILFKEFALKYLFSWSDVLWPFLVDQYPLYSNAQHLNNKYSADDTRKSECQALERMHAGLKNVRRGMANISTLMILDDHEVTDDLFINLDWSERVLGSIASQSDPDHTGRESGRRLIANAMAAYTVFQGCGNVEFTRSLSPTQVAAFSLNHQRIQDFTEVFDTLELIASSGLTYENASYSKLMTIPNYAALLYLSI